MNRSIPLHWRSPGWQHSHPELIVMKYFGLTDTPRCFHASVVPRNVDTRRFWTQESAVGETVLGMIVSYLSETLQPLWAREQGEAGISLPKSTTEHKYNPCVGLLQPGPCPWWRNFIGHSPSSLVWFHNLPTVHTTLQQDVTAVPYIKPWNENRQCQLSEPHPKY